MQRLLVLSALSLALSAGAQNCAIVQQQLPPNISGGFKEGFQRADGELFRLNSLPGRGFAVSRSHADGTVVWSHQIPPKNPALTPQSSAITATAAGGALVSGDQLVAWDPYFHIYINQFAAELNEDGEPLWARMYMLDSNDVFYPHALHLYEQPGYGYLYVLNTDLGVSISRLDNAGIPVWTRRYQVGGNVAFSALLPESDGGFTIFSYGGGGRMIRCAADGTVQWAKQYGGAHSIEPWLVRRAHNGDYITAGGPLGPLAIVARLNDQGDVLWRRTFPIYDYGEGLTKLSLEENASGHILLLGANQLFEMDADGAMLGAWDFDYAQLQNRDVLQFLVPDVTTSDSVVIGYARNNGDAYSPALMLSPGTSDLACAFTPFSLLDTLTATDAPTVPTVQVIRDTLRTWTMNIDLPQLYTERDPYCALLAGHARPGFEHQVTASVQNGTIMPTGPVTATLTFPAEVNYVSATPAPSSVVGQTITWQLPALAAYDVRYLQTTFLTPADPGLLGTSIDYTFAFTQDSSDVDLTNNTAIETNIITGAFDPNAKEVVPTDIYLLGTDSVLDYTIRFQNTGTAAATNVALVDTLPLDLDASTFRMLSSTHPFTYTLTGNGILAFHFANIDLPDSNTSEAASHGAVRFRIKPLQPLSVGQVITNRADIFFDFNPAIRTDDATVVVSTSTGLPTAAAPPSLHLFPVPTKNTLSAQLPKNFQPTAAWAVGENGQHVPLVIARVAEDQALLNVQRLAPGGYVLTLWNAKGERLSARFVVER